MGMNTVMIIVTAIIASIAGTGLVLAIINHKISWDLSHILEDAERVSENKMQILEYERSTEAQITYLFSRILEDLYTTEDMRIVAWKLYQLRDVGAFIKHRHGNASETLRDVLIQRVILGPTEDALAVVEMMNDKLKAYYNLDSDINDDWRLLLGYLITHREEGQRINDIYKKSETALRNRLACLHFDGAILDTVPDFPIDKSTKELFDETLEELKEEWGRMTDENSLDIDEAAEKAAPDPEPEDAAPTEESPAEEPVVEEEEPPMEEEKTEEATEEIPVDISNLKRRPQSETPVTIY